MAIHTATLEETAQALVAPGKGILAADESGGTIKKRFDTIGVEVAEEDPPRVPRPAVHNRGRGGLHQRRDPLRRDDPAVGSDGTPFPKLAREQGDRPGHQGRQRREGPRERAGRDGHRGARRPGAAGEADAIELEFQRALAPEMPGILGRFQMSDQIAAAWKSLLTKLGDSAKVAQDGIPDVDRSRGEIRFAHGALQKSTGGQDDVPCAGAQAQRKDHKA